ncbi:MAG: hypothetical protein KTR30_26005 [Saprospiraceae bacterium]|nr:hypothetical protein [Saprospiraceae bacterium]
MKNRKFLYTMALMLIGIHLFSQPLSSRHKQELKDLTQDMGILFNTIKGNYKSAFQSIDNRVDRIEFEYTAGKYPPLIPPIVEKLMTYAGGKTVPLFGPAYKTVTGFLKKGWKAHIKEVEAKRKREAKSSYKRNKANLKDWTEEATDGLHQIFDDRNPMLIRAELEKEMRKIKGTSKRAKYLAGLKEFVEELGKSIPSSSQIELITISNWLNIQHSWKSHSKGTIVSYIHVGENKNGKNEVEQYVAPHTPGWSELGDRLNILLAKYNANPHHLYMWKLVIIDIPKPGGGRRLVQFIARRNNEINYVRVYDDTWQEKVKEYDFPSEVRELAENKDFFIRTDKVGNEYLHPRIADKFTKEIPPKIAKAMGLPAQ